MNKKNDRAVQLDDLYKMVSHIYAEQNAIRSPSATFGHFVEVCGMLTMKDRKKKREGGTFVDALCRALGWYFPLVAKFGIASVEELIFRKFPLVCPYCRLAPHQEQRCKQVKGTSATVDHDALLEAYEANTARRPVTLNDWQAMFQEIYPRTTSESGKSTIGLLEELGELAEAIRVFDRYPKYFLGEAADTFSYLMGLANEYQISVEMEGGQFSFEDEFLKRYPGLCPQCGFMVCVCPSIPEATVGRMAKELDVVRNDKLFVTDPTEFSADGRATALAAIEGAGGYEGLATRFPFDRGDANRGLVLLCLKLASAIDPSQKDTIDRLQSAAIRIGANSTYAGSPKHGFDDIELLSAIRDAWRGAGETARKDASAGLLTQLMAEMIGKIRILFVGASPTDASQLRVSSEHRAILEAVRLSKGRDMFVVEHLPAPTVDDLRRALLGNTFEIVHFSGHGDGDFFCMHGEDGLTADIPMEGLRELVSLNKSVKCVILNSCKSATNLQSAVGPLTVAMDDNIGDDAAIEFARGFYDAVGAGQELSRAVAEGMTAAKVKGLTAPQIVVVPPISKASSEQGSNCAGS